MTGLIRKLLKDRRGNTLAIAAACIPLVVGAAGLATDTIQWTLWKRQLQRAADSAAIAGVYDRSTSAGSTSTVSRTVSHDLTINDHTWMAVKSGYPIVQYDSNCPVSGSTTVMTNRVCVTLAVQQRLPFSSIFVSTAPTIIAKSTAASVPGGGGDACVNARETNGNKTGINNTGNAGIYMPDCVMYSNSPSTNSAAAGGSSNVTASAVAAVGGVQQSNNWHVQAYRPYSPAIDDPFANVSPSPSDMNCSNSTLDQDTNVSSMRATGTNCWSSLRVNSNKTLTLPDGIYYINGGDAFVQGDLSCNSCTIVLTNKDTSSTATIGQFKDNAGSKINMTAPTSGTFKGIAIYQDRRAVDSNQTNKVNGNSNSIITGALYFPNQELDYNGTGNTTATCTMFVARRVTFSGNSATTNKFKSMSQCGAEGLPSSSSLRTVRLVA